LSNDLANTIRVTAAAALAGRGPMGPDEFTFAFWNSYIARSSWMLMNLMRPVQTMPDEKFRALAPHLAPIALFRTDIPLVDDNPVTAIMLRVLQFSVAAVTGHEDQFAAGAKAALREVAETSSLEMKHHLEVMVLMKALFFRGVKLAWQLRFEWISRLERIIKYDASLLDVEDTSAIGEMRAAYGQEADFFGFLVLIGSQVIDTPEDLKGMLDALAALPEDVRRRRLQQLKVFQQGYGLPVQQAWANADRTGNLDASAAIYLYREMAAMARGWQDEDLAAECVVAQSVLTDEYLQDPEAALDILAEAIRGDGGNTILLRQKAKVLGHLKRYEEAAPILAQVQPKIARGSKIELTYVLSEAAVASANSGDHFHANALFCKAAESAAETAGEVRGMHYHHIALRAEAAICLWRTKQRKEAIASFAAVVELLDGVDPAEDHSALLLHAKVRYAVGWLDAVSLAPTRHVPLLQPGAIQAIDSKLEVDELKGTNVELKILLKTVGLRNDVENLFDNISVDTKPSGLVLFMRAAEVDLCYRDGAPERVAVALKNLVVAHYRTWRRLQGASDGRDDGLSDVEIAYAHLDVPLLTTFLHSNIALACYRAYLDDRFGSAWLDQLVTALRVQLCAPVDAFRNILDVASNRRDAHPGNPPEQVLQIARAKSPEPDPVSRLGQHLNIVVVAVSAAAGISSVRAILGRIAAEWRFVCERQRFLLPSPMLHVPEIMWGIDLVERLQPGGLSALMDAASAAVRKPLGPDWQPVIANLGGDIT
jgi:tetratricopeptide (TPR) repeat protein